jgi:hypothetical protein
VTVQPTVVSDWEYDILFGEDDEELCMLVNAAMRKNWYPVGGVATSVVPQYDDDGVQYGTKTYLRQSMIRHAGRKRAKPNPTPKTTGGRVAP